MAFALLFRHGSGVKAGIIWHPRFRQIEKSLSRVKTVPSGFRSAIRGGARLMTCVNK